MYFATINIMLVVVFQSLGLQNPHGLFTRTPTRVGMYLQSPKR